MRQLTQHGVFGRKLTSITIKGQHKANWRVVLISLCHVSTVYQFFDLPRKTQDTQLFGFNVQIFPQHAGRRLRIGLQGTAIAQAHHRILRRYFAREFDGVPLQLVFGLPSGLIADSD